MLLVMMRENHEPGWQRDEARGVLNDEDDWHAVRAAYIINNNCTIAGAWGYMGPVGNTFGNCAWGLQFKYEF